MSGFAYNYDDSGIARALDRLVGKMEPAEITASIAGLLESQTRVRLSEDKTGPDGSPWPEWSENYAATRMENQSLLENEGNLIDSITAYSDSRVATVGSPLVYAAIHQFGGAEVGSTIPAREYLGISDANAQEIIRVVEDLGEEVFDGC